VFVCATDYDVGAACNNLHPTVSKQTMPVKGGKKQKKTKEERNKIISVLKHYLLH
jgi:hypothetical protein